MKKVSKEQYLACLRRRSSGFSRAVSNYRGVARHRHNGRWEDRIGRVFGNKYLYLGTYNTQEEAAAAYDMAALEFRGTNAVTNFDISHYIEGLKQKGILIPDQTQEQVLGSAGARRSEPELGQPLEEREQQPRQGEEADKPQNFHQCSIQMQLPLCVENSTIVGVETTDRNELAWSFSMDSGLTSSFLVPVHIPLEKTSELPSLFDRDMGFEDNIKLIFDVGENEKLTIRECVSDEATSCGVAVGGAMVEEDNGKDSLSSDSPTSSTTSVSCNYV